MSNMTGDEGSFSSGNTGEEVEKHQTQQPEPDQPALKKKRNLPGTPDPSAEVIALSPTTLMATNRFVCEICNKGFQRDQNLQLHRRGHNLPWKLRQRTTTEVRKRVYICPEPTCVHHNPARALGDLTGIKKHFSRKHGEKKWKCDKCSKKYAVQSDWKAHQKTCGTREYKCDCGTIFSRRDSFITHRAFCDALAEENNKVNQGLIANMQHQIPNLSVNPNTCIGISSSDFDDPNKNPLKDLVPIMPFKSMHNITSGPMFSTSSATLFAGPRTISSSSSTSSLQLSSSGSQIPSSSAQMSATALLQKAAQMGATATNTINSPMMQKTFSTSMSAPEPPFQHQTTSAYDTFPSDQTQMVGIMNGGGIINSNNNQMQSPFFDGGSGMNDMGMFSSMFMGTDSNPGFMKNMEQTEDNCGPVLMRGGRAPGRFGGEGGDVMTTRDFMGIGGSRMEMEAMSQQRMTMMNHYQQHQHLSSTTPLDKPNSSWDISN
ncbi:C2H2-like zinc finger protein [Euphorbia peplus]|nr:C2H2-like zinc finger protein [Euphorbia peplus]